jgi:hypothetical protein
VSIPLNPARDPVDKVLSQRARTKTPLRILVLPPVTRWKEEIAELVVAGHEVYNNDKAANPQWPQDFDLIIGRAAWHCDNVHKPYLKKAVKAAQALINKKKAAREAEDAN